jgi:hypothetical protein
MEDVMASFAADQDGIRSYGPGKFYTVIDSYAYSVTLDGGADEDESEPDGGGWYSLLWIDNDTRKVVRQNARERGDTLTGEEEDLLKDSEAVIFFERSDGIVEADWFDNRKEAEDAWAEILAEFEGEEEEND